MVKNKMKMKAAVTAATVRRLTARLEAHYMSNKSITEEHGKINENVFLLFRKEELHEYSR